MAKEKDELQLALDKLTPQRRKFVEGFCATFNATKAAEGAKYSKKTARTQGSQLLTILDIQKAVALTFKKGGMSPEEIVARWARMARASLDDFYTRVEYEERTSVKQSLTEAIEKIKEDIEYEYEFMVRSWDVLRTSEDDRAKELVNHEKYKRMRRIDILRHTMQLERDPKAFRLIDGPPVKKHRMELDLVKAEALGMLDIVKTITPGEFGLKLELRDPDKAMENLAKHLGMLTSKVDITTNGQSLGAPDLSKLSNEELLAYEELLRKTQPADATAS